MKKIILSIIIPVFNNWNFTKSCLEDLSKLPNDHEIIIVNNGSTDSTFKNLINIGSFIKHPNIVIVHNTNNIGFAKGCNKGYATASGKYIMFLNNDIRVKKDHSIWTQKIIYEAEDGSIVGPTIGVLDDNFNFVGEFNKKPSKGFIYISGWNITARKDIWQKLILDGDNGPFRGKIFCYHEDSDLGGRALQLNIPLKIVDVPVHHFGRMTGKKMNLGKMYQESKKIFLNIWKK